MQEDLKKVSPDNREIKFRAFYPDRKIQMAYFDIKSAVENARKLNELDYKDIRDYKSLMQSTGLKDKNLVEIYEGDIFEFIDPIYKSKKYVTIIYNNNKCRFEGNKSVRCSHKDIPNLLQYGCIVIGNIYQNPELLSEK